MGSQDILLPIPRDQWPTLRDMFRRDWPRHQVAYRTVQNYINWVQIDPRIKDLEVLGLNDSWKENGTYIIVDRYQMFLHTLDDPDNSLKRALQLIDWDYSYLLCCVDESFHNTLRETLKTLSVEVLADNPNYGYELAREECLKLDAQVPEGAHIRKLEVEHAIMANNIWPHRCDGSEYFLKRLAAWNTSVGLFSESGELMAWCFHWPSGAIGPLEVAKKHYRKGYGSVVLKAITKEVAKTGLSCFGNVMHTNVPSNGMFQKAGFKQIGTQYYMRTRARKLVEYSY